MICWLPHALGCLQIFMFWVSQVKPLLLAFPVSVLHQGVSICSSARVYRHASASQIWRRHIPRVSGKHLAEMKPSIVFWCKSLRSIYQQKQGDSSRGRAGVESSQIHAKTTSFPQIVLHPFLLRNRTNLVSLCGPDHQITGWMWIIVWELLL